MLLSSLRPKKSATSEKHEGKEMRKMKIAISQSVSTESDSYKLNAAFKMSLENMNFPQVYISRWKESLKSQIRIIGFGRHVWRSSSPTSASLVDEQFGFMSWHWGVCVCLWEVLLLFWGSVYS